MHSSNPKFQAGFTLTEMMVATSVFTMIMGAVLAMNIFAARSTSGVARMLELGAKSNVLNLLCNDVKNARSAAVQNYSSSIFSSIAYGSAQQGNALKVVVPSGTNTATIYYYVDDSGDMWRWDTTSTNNTAKRYLTDLTNTVVFSSEDYSGAIVSNTIARTLIDINVFILDENPRDFRQILNLRASAEIRNW
jgi:prepilin-type N-terminal cleavage/methylation domain-containing protein